MGAIKFIIGYSRSDTRILIYRIVSIINEEVVGDSCCAPGFLRRD